jgi:hypothetical protein
MFLSFFGGYFVWVFGSETATKQSWHLGSDLFIQGLGLLELQDKEKPFLVPLSLSLSLCLSPNVIFKHNTGRDQSTSSIPI